MRNVLVIGIGAGDSEQVTVQAIRAMNRVDVFFVLDKGGRARSLAAELGAEYVQLAELAVGTPLASALTATVRNLPRRARA